MYPDDYLIEKLESAVYELVVGEGDARSRVGEGYYKFWTIGVDNYPEHLQSKRRKIDELLTRLPAEEGAIIPSNLRRMKNKTASKIALLIYELCFEMNEYVLGKKHIT
ncbi:MAG: hypothetical protein U5O39_19930 [Gammaproteobacteria bacterium]|nr:hypothetical protein [Gammaproteobacteria bacterium]